MIIKNTYKVLNIEQGPLFSLSEIKHFLRISYDYDDNLILSLLSFAIDFAEKFLSRTLRPRHISFITNNINAQKFCLKYKPIVEIKKVIKKTNGNEVEVKDYALEEEKWELRIYPLLTEKEELIIEYIAGYREENLPLTIKQGILLHISQMYDNNEQSSILSEQIKTFYLPYRNLKI